MFNDSVIADGDAVVAYFAPVSAPGGACFSETRICLSGQLTGSFTHASCTVQTTAPCTFNGQEVPHGSSVTAFVNSNVAYGGTCTSEQRTCNNGVLSGSYDYASCEVGQPAACLFNGNTLNHGASATAYQNSTVPFGSQCVSESRTCDNGALSGSYENASCTVGAPAVCRFNGKDVAHGTSVVAYKTSTVAYGTKCVSEVRNCSNGMLGGTYSYASCAPAAPKACLFNGKTVPHKGRVLAYYRGKKTINLPCKAQYRVCDNGKLSGTYGFAACNAKGNCLLGGITKPVGAYYTAFLAPSVKAPQKCVSQRRTCTTTSSVPTGSYRYLSCSVVP